MCLYCVWLCIKLFLLYCCIKAAEVYLVGYIILVLNCILICLRKYPDFVFLDFCFSFPSVMILVFDMLFVTQHAFSISLNFKLIVSINEDSVCISKFKLWVYYISFVSLRQGSSIWEGITTKSILLKQGA